MQGLDKSVQGLDCFFSVDFFVTTFRKKNAIAFIF